MAGAACTALPPGAVEVAAALAPYVIGALAFLAALATAFLRGRKSKSTEQQLRQAKADAETRKRIDEASTVGDDPHLARRWLRERSQSGGDL